MSCLTTGSMILTKRGEVAVEDLRVGDRVITRDHKQQKITKIYRKRLTGRFLLDHPHLRPVLIRESAFEAGMPARDTMVASNSRLPIVAREGGFLRRAVEEMTAVKLLQDHDTVQQIDMVGIEYFLLQFNRHEILAVNGVWMENFNPFDMSLGNVGNSQRVEILEIFPELQALRRAERPVVKSTAKLRVGALRRRA